MPSLALAQDQADLAKQSQNPVADLISLPFQNNTFFGVGPDDDVANVLNIQPVIPINLGPVNPSATDEKLGTSLALCFAAPNMTDHFS